MSPHKAMNVLVKDTPWDSHSFEGLPVKGSKMRPPASIHPGYFQTNTKYLPNLFFRKKMCTRYQPQNHPARHTRQVPRPSSAIASSHHLAHMTQKGGWCRGALWSTCSSKAKGSQSQSWLREKILTKHDLKITKCFKLT